jgi:hypothetical protein
MNVDKQDKNKKVQMLLDYAKECYKQGHKPTKKEIRLKFHLEIYNYFKNIGDYHKKAGIAISLRNYPKDKAKELIINYLKEKAVQGVYPTRKEIEKELKIHFSSYFKDLKELYDLAEIKYELIQNRIKEKTVMPHTYNKETLQKQRESIESFIKEKVKEGIYPSVNYLQKKLNLAFYNLYNNIFEAYKNAGVDYERISPIILGKKKEQVFTQIVKGLLQKMGFTIQRVSIESETNFNRNADMVVLDKDGNKTLVEIKAYRDDYCITCREFEQLQ